MIREMVWSASTSVSIFIFLFFFVLAEANLTNNKTNTGKRCIVNIG